MTIEYQSLVGLLWWAYYSVRARYSHLGDLTMSLTGFFHPIKTAVDSAVSQVKADESAALVRAKADANAVIAQVKTQASAEIARLEAEIVAAREHFQVELAQAAADVKAAVGKAKADALAVNPQLGEEAKVLAEKLIDAAIAALAAHGV